LYMYARGVVLYMYVRGVILSQFLLRQEQ
jgi:hypothetical protein